MYQESEMQYKLRQRGRTIEEPQVSQTPASLMGEPINDQLRLSTTKISTVSDPTAAKRPECSINLSLADVIYEHNQQRSASQSDRLTKAILDDL